MAGAHPKAVQAIMRHSTIVLTMDTYGHRLIESQVAVGPSTGLARSRAAELHYVCTYTFLMAFCNSCRRPSEIRS